MFPGENGPVITPKNGCINRCIIPARVEVNPESNIEMRKDVPSHFEKIDQGVCTGSATSATPATCIMGWTTIVNILVKILSDDY